jgi:hypothetical protein
MATALHAQNSPQSHADFQRTQISSLVEQYASATLVQKKQIELKLAALDYSITGKPIEKNLEVLIAGFELDVFYYTQQGDAVHVEKCKASINYLTAQLVETKKQALKTTD